jgi:hypothetical protein
MSRRPLRSNRKSLVTRHSAPDNVYGRLFAGANATDWQPIRVPLRVDSVAKVGQ